jgi:hypothetical protein
MTDWDLEDAKAQVVLLQADLARMRTSLQTQYDYIDRLKSESPEWALRLGFVTQADADAIEEKVREVERIAADMWSVITVSQPARPDDEGESFSWRLAVERVHNRWIQWISRPAKSSERKALTARPGDDSL